MDKREILENNFDDLRVGINLAEIANNEILKKYMIERLTMISKEIKKMESISLNMIADSYAIDLVLLNESSNVLEDKEAKEYFRSKLMGLIRFSQKLVREKI